MKYVLNYYYLIYCKLFIILIGSNRTTEKNTMAKKGLKEKTFNKIFFRNSSKNGTK